MFASHPLGGDGAWIDAVGVEANPGHDVRATLRRLEQRFGFAYALKSWRGVGQKDARHARMQTDENRVGLEQYRVGDQVLPDGEIKSAMLGDGLLDRRRIVRDAISLHTQRVHVQPTRRRGQLGNIGGNGIRHSTKLGCVVDVAYRRRVADVVKVKSV